MPILSGDVLNVPPGTETVTSRNLIQLPDGTLLLGVGAGTDIDYLWRSQDEGGDMGQDAASAGACGL